MAQGSSGLRGAQGSGLRAQGSGLRGAEGSGLRAQGSSGLRAQGSGELRAQGSSIKRAPTNLQGLRGGSGAQGLFFHPLKFLEWFD